MKKNDFENEYREYREIEDQFNAISRTTRNDADLDAPRARMHELYERVSAKGDDYAGLFTAYKNARNDDNEYIDLNDTIWDGKVPALVESMRGLGIEHFTFSSTWSSAIETAWLFTENGCRLEGLIQINGSWDPMDAKFVKKPAYLFSIQ